MVRTVKTHTQAYLAIHVLLPIRRQNGLDILRTLIDGLIPRQPGLLTEGGHGLDQLIDFRIQEMLTVTRLKIFDLIGSRACIPILNGHRVR